MAQKAPILLEEGWNKLSKNGIEKLHKIIKDGLRTGFSNDEYVALYGTCYEMCIQKAPHCYTPQLYERFENSINQYLTNVVLPEILSKPGEFLIKELVKRWTDHKLMEKWLCAIFTYIDRFFVKRHNKKPLHEVCVLRFHAVVFDAIKTKTAAILDVIAKDRNGEQIDRSLIKEALSIYVDMGMTSLSVYQEQFQAQFIEATISWYGRESARWLADDSCPEYLRKAEKRIDDEAKRLSDYLHPSSDEILQQTLNDVLLIKHQSEILDKENTGLLNMLQMHSSDDLSRMYNLYSRVPASLAPIASTVRKHITEEGSKLTIKMEEAKQQEHYVEELIKLHEKYYDMVMGCFCGNAVFHKALKEAFENIVNKKAFQSTTAELLAVYSDFLLRKDGLKLQEKQLQVTLDNVVRLFAYLSEKDIFSEHYRKLLSKRLLNQRSASDDAEKSMIGKLKLRCGAQFTSKFEGMINDMRTASDSQRAFVDYIRDTGTDLESIDFSVQTLTTGSWPTFKTEEIKLAPEMTKCIDTFTAFYNTKTNNRKLRWVHHLGSVTIAGYFTKRRIDLVVTAIQATILLLFNESDEISIDQLIKLTGLSADRMKKELRPLASGKFNILKKNPPAGYAESHTMKVNLAFTSQQLRLRVPAAGGPVSADDRETANANVSEDRKHAVEACIVRVMKARKTLQHQQLIVEVSTQLMTLFKPDPKDIKKRIEDLISREYLERDSEKANVYHYLA